MFLIIQRPEFLVKSARLLVNRWLLCDDMAQWRMPFFRVPVPFLGGFVRRLAFDRMGNQVSRGMCLGDKRSIGRYYDTAQSIATEGRVMSVQDWQEPPRDITDPLLVVLLLVVLLRVWLFGVLPW